jgi:hypothetical protein
MKFNSLSKWTLLEVLFLLAFALNLTNQLLVEPLVGLANNADFYRIMDWTGLDYLTDNSDELYYAHMIREFAIGEPAGEGEYVTSELVFVRIAIFLDKLFTQDQIFSILSLGAVHAATYTLVAVIVVFALQGYALWLRTLVYGLVFFMFGDVGYVAYFNSLYSEPASLLFLGFSLGFAFWYSRALKKISSPPLILFAYFVSTTLFVTAKPQNAVAGVPLALLGVGLALVPCRDEHKRVTRFIAVTMALGILVIAGIEVRDGQPGYLKRDNLFNVVFYNILNHSPTPEEDMAELGIDDPAYRALIGYNIYQVDDFAPQMVRDFQYQVGYSAILRFYANHPGRFLDVVGRVSKQTFLLRPPNLGNYERKTGKRFSNTMAFWSNFRSGHLPGTTRFVLLFFAICFFGVGFKWRRFDRTAHDKALTLIHLAVMVVALAQWLLVIIGEGATDATKQLFLFNALVDVNIILLLLYLAALISQASLHQIRSLKQNLS